jgi:hypothetical protein
MMNTSRHGGNLNCNTQEKHAVQSCAPAEVYTFKPLRRALI